jgi:hypothetical protein
MRSRTSHHRPDGQSGRRAGGAIVAVCLLAATACSSDGDKTTAESTSTAAPATAAEESVDEPTTTEPPETAPSTDAPTTEPETEEPAVTASSDDGGASVSVVLTDGAVVLDQTSTNAGSVEIVAKNVGGDLHDLVIVKGDDPAALPVNEDGAVIEDDLPEDDFIGRFDVVDPGTEESALFDLDAGSYILFCNIFNPTAIRPLPRSHFQDGMVSTFTVT